MKTNKEIVRSYYENLWNKQDKSYINKLLSDDIVFRGSLEIEVKGKEEFAKYFDMIIGAIPNLYHSIELLIEEDDYVSAKAVYNGTQSGKLLDFEATNKRIQYNGASFFSLEDGMITDIWVLGDLNSLYKQLR